MSIKQTLPDVSWAEGYENHEYAAHILARIANAMAETMNDPGLQRMYVKDSLALTRQWRKTLPHQGKRSEMYGRFTQRDLLRIAARHIITADDIAEHSSEPHPTARPLRYAEAALRTWLKGQQP